MAFFEGNILKMKTALADVVHYQLPIGEELVPMNELLGKNLTLEFRDEINCISCGTKTQKSFSQGYCYKCFISVPETSECILNPELCQAHLGISRNMEWSKNHCLTNHYVYLAVSSGLKVGVTRSSQIPTRWMDQGASKAIKLAMTPNRYLAGAIEVALKKHISDKTSWQKMLKNEVDLHVDLENEKQKAWELLSIDLQQYVIEDDEITEIKYPVISFPSKVKSIGFDTLKDYTGRLTGIKGQYLIFENSLVLNIRKHGGYRIRVKF